MAYALYHPDYEAAVTPMLAGAVAPETAQLEGLVDPAYHAAINPYRAAIRRRQRGGAVPWGPIPQMIALALDRRLHLPEHHYYAPHPLDYVPDPYPRVPHPLEVLGTLLHGLEFGGG